MKFGKRVEIYRKKRGLTREELSSMVGISESSLRDLELINSTPRGLQNFIPLIANSLGIAVTELFSDLGSADRTEKINVTLTEIQASCEKIRLIL